MPPGESSPVSWAHCSHEGRCHRLGSQAYFPFRSLLLLEERSRSSYLILETMMSSGYLCILVPKLNIWKWIPRVKAPKTHQQFYALLLLCSKSCNDSLFLRIKAAILTGAAASRLLARCAYQPHLLWLPPCSLLAASWTCQACASLSTCALAVPSTPDKHMAHFLSPLSLCQFHFLQEALPDYPLWSCNLSPSPKRLDILCNLSTFILLSPPLQCTLHKGSKFCLLCSNITCLE